MAEKKNINLKSVIPLSITLWGLKGKLVMGKLDIWVSGTYRKQLYNIYFSKLLWLRLFKVKIGMVFFNKDFSYDDGNMQSCSFLF